MAGKYARALMEEEDSVQLYPGPTQLMVAIFKMTRDYICIKLSVATYLRWPTRDMLQIKKSYCK